MATISRDRVQHFRGHDLYDRDGEKIGAIEEIYLDAETNEPEWALVHTGLFGTKRTFVPLRDASERDEDPLRRGGEERGQGRARHRPERAALPARGGRALPPLRARLLRAALGHDDRTATATPTRAGPSGTTCRARRTDDAMTRSEEELRVGTTEREAGRARLKKYVVTENETRTVPVKREEVRIEREPITDANVGDATDGPSISEEEHEVVLHEEEVVAEKRAVPKERVRLDKDVEVDQETVSEDVRKERIDIDDATGTDRR